MCIVICGVDEAGKGAVLGPMVIAAAGCGEEEDLSGLGLADSKTLTRKRREHLFTLIEKRFSTAVIYVSAGEIDRIRTEMTLNACVARAHAAAIGQLGADRALVDACDVNAPRFAASVGAYVGYECSICAEHHADSRHPIVAAASIVAKVSRDRAIEKLKTVYGEIGSGYPSDAVTVGFLQAFIDGHGTPPGCARASWQTVIRMIEVKNQSNISDFQ